MTTTNTKEISLEGLDRRIDAKERLKAGFPVGARITLPLGKDVYPDASVRPGETGTVILNEGENSFCVLLDQHHDGLDHWDNWLIWNGESALDILAEIESVK